MYPDSAAWFAVLEGEIRFEVEKTDRTFEIINATKGSYVFVPERLLHSVEVVGAAPAIRYEVTLGPVVHAGVREETRRRRRKASSMCRSR